MRAFAVPTVANAVMMTKMMTTETNGPGEELQEDDLVRVQLYSLQPLFPWEMQVFRFGFGPKPALMPVFGSKHIPSRPAKNAVKPLVEIN